MNEELNNAPVIDAGGESRILGLQMPELGSQHEFPLLTADAPTFRPWTRNEILDAIRLKPYKRRTVFTTDWMQDQKGHGSCNACAAAYVQRKGQYLRGRFDTPVLNWEFLYAQINGGRDQGSLLVDGMKALASIGAPILSPEHKIGTGRIYKNRFTPEEYAAASLNKSTAWYVVRDELTLATAVLAGFPAVVAVHVGGSFTSLDRNGYAGADSGMGNHAVHVDDVEVIDGELAFDHQGSWGTRMHEDGRAYLSWNRHFRQTVQHHDFWVLLSTNDGDDPMTK